MNGTTWRVGAKVPLNVYDGNRPVCQCHTVEDACLIVASLNSDSRRTDEQGAIATPIADRFIDSLADALHYARRCETERDQAQAQRRELAQALKPFADYAKNGGEDDDSLKIGHYFGGPTMGECRKARALLAAHPEWLK